MGLRWAERSQLDRERNYLSGEKERAGLKIHKICILSCMSRSGLHIVISKQVQADAKFAAPKASSSIDFEKNSREVTCHFSV